jgi:Domain of unknown function (DUF4112)
MSNPVRTRSSEPLVATREPAVERLRTLARLLDTAFQVPGTRYRFGIDAIIGLVPGIGDAISAIFSMFIVFHAARMGVSRATLMRMLGNVALDTIVGEVPLLGDLFDAGWKSNTRNIGLLESHLERPVSTRRSSRRVVILVGVALLLLLAGVIALGVLVAELVLSLVR